MRNRLFAATVGTLVAAGLVPAASAGVGSAPHALPPLPPGLHVVLDCRGTITLIEFRDRILYTAPGDPTCPAGTGIDAQHNETLVVDSS
jgi:hypothetical protein